MIDERAINHVETLTSLSSEVGVAPYLEAPVLKAALGGRMCHWTAILQLSSNNRDMALEANWILPFDLWLSKQRETYQIDVGNSTMLITNFNQHLMIINSSNEIKLN